MLSAKMAKRLKPSNTVDALPSVKQLASLGDLAPKPKKGSDEQPTPASILTSIGALSAPGKSLTSIKPSGGQAQAKSS